MSKDGTTNILLTVIAVCLVLIVARIYEVDRFTEAHSAQANAVTQIAVVLIQSSLVIPAAAGLPFVLIKKAS